MRLNFGHLILDLQINNSEFQSYGIGGYLFNMSTQEGLSFDFVVPNNIEISEVVVYCLNLKIITNRFSVRDSGYRRVTSTSDGHTYEQIAPGGWRLLR